MNDVQFSDTPIAPGSIADYCARYPNQPICSHLVNPAPSGTGGNNNGGHHHGHHDHHHNGGHGGDNGHHHPLS